MKKILYIAVIRYAKGGTPHMLSAALWLAKKGYDVTVIGPGESSGELYETPVGNVKVDLVQHAEGDGKLWFYLRLCLKLIKYRLKTDALFYVHGSSVCASAFLPLMYINPKRLVYHTQDFLEPGRYPHWEYFERRIARRASHVICNEPNRARFFASHYELKKNPLVVRTALPSDWPAPERNDSMRKELLSAIGLESAKDVKIIVAGGGYSDVRCTKQLVKAVAGLPPEYVILFSGVAEGSASERDLRDLLSETNMEKRAIVIGYIPYAQLLEHYAFSDIGILLYPNDGVGNYYQAPGRLTEYLISGLSFVTSDFPGLEQLVNQYGLGVTVDSESISDIAMGIKKLGLRSEKERSEDRLRLQKCAANELSYDKQVICIEDMVAELCQ